MKNIFKKLFITLIVVSFASCDLGDDKELDYGSGAFVAQFPYAEKTGFFLKDDAVIYDYEIPVQLVGGNGLALDTDVTVSYEVDLANSTAVEGVNFDFVNATNVALIPAGSTFANISIKVKSGTLDDQDPPVLVLKLTQAAAGGTTVVTSENKGSIALTLQGTCISDLSGSYNNVTIRVDPAGGPYTFTSDMIDEISDGTYNTTYVGQYYAPGNDPGTGATAVLGAASDAGYTFKEVCGRIRVETQNLASIYSNEVRQSTAQYNASSVSETGVITIEYSIFFTNNTVERKYRSVYTPN